MSSLNNNQKILLGSVIVAACSIAAYIFVASSSSSREITDNNNKKKSTDNTENTKKSKTTPTTKSTNSTNSNEVIVEDDEDDDDEEENLKKQALAALQSQYDDTYRVAKKRLDGKDYKNAAIKFTELINLAPKLPSANKDLITLYNNRSAMFEKLGEYQESLSDITGILAMDNSHFKARVRRARIYEVQGKLQDSLDEFIVGMTIEKMNGKYPSNHEKIDEIVRKIALKDTIAIFAKIRSSKDRQLPTRSYCRNFLETFPSQHRWISKYKDSCELKNELEENINNAKESGDNIDILDYTLRLASYNIANGTYSSGFQLVKECEANVLSLELLSNKDKVTPSSVHHAVLLSLQMELYGTELHLKCNLNDSMLAYQRALVYNPLNFEASLKLASIHLEIGEFDDAEAMYATVLSQMNDESSAVDTKEIDTSKKDNIMCDKAWVLLHRSSLWISRKEGGGYRPQACDKSIEDIDAVLNLTGNYFINSISFILIAFYWL
jgi:tetratricopeptide (TPR) repeat protein